MSEQEQDRHATDAFSETDEPDVEGHLHDVGNEREAQDAATEREAQDAATDRHRLEDAL